MIDTRYLAIQLAHEKISGLKKAIEKKQEKLEKKKKQIQEAKMLIDYYKIGMDKISQCADALNTSDSSYQAISDNVFKIDVFEGVASEQLLNSMEEATILLISTVKYMDELNICINSQIVKLNTYVTEKEREASELRWEIVELEEELAALESGLNTLA